MSAAKNEEGQKPSGFSGISDEGKDEKSEGLLRVPGDGGEEGEQEDSEEEEDDSKEEGEERIGESDKMEKKDRADYDPSGDAGDNS